MDDGKQRAEPAPDEAKPAEGQIEDLETTDSDAADVKAGTRSDRGVVYRDVSGGNY
jgi:hypothetical protein